MANTVGDPEALLLVEFAEDEAENRVAHREAFRADRRSRFRLGQPRRKWGGVVEVFDPRWQSALAEMRKSGLNIMMSMKQEGKPVSFVEDCAVPLPRLAEYTQRVDRNLRAHGTRGTWYAHASVGSLHVRRCSICKFDKDRAAMRAIAEEAFAMAGNKGSPFGEHGTASRARNLHEAMLGRDSCALSRKSRTGSIPRACSTPAASCARRVSIPRSYLRLGPSCGRSGLTPALDWQAYPGGAGGFQGAAGMCNNNGACRKLEGGAMCPSYRVTRDEKDVTRGRANTLRLALSGQLGPDALTSDEVAEALNLCVSCKASSANAPRASTWRG